MLAMTDSNQNHICFLSRICSITSRLNFASSRYWLMCILLQNFSNKISFQLSTVYPKNLSKN